MGRIASSWVAREWSLVARAWPWVARAWPWVAREWAWVGRWGSWVAWEGVWMRRSATGRWRRAVQLSAWLVLSSFAGLAMVVLVAGDVLADVSWSSGLRVLGVVVAV